MIRGSKRLAVAAALTASFLTAGIARAGIFDTADGYYRSREANAANAQSARAEYLRLLPSLSGADLAYAVQQIGLLATYEGSYLIPDSDGTNARKTQLFNECRQAASRLQSDASQKTVYAFWRLSCTALWLKYATTVQRLAELSQIKAYFDDLVGPDLEIKPAHNLDMRYQGGGLSRALSAVYSNQLSSLIRQGLPNGAKALEMADRAIASRAFPGDVNTGADYYRNYRHKAEALNFLGRTADAQTVLTDAIAEVEERQADGDLPRGVEPETKGEVDIMKGMLSALEP